MQTVATSNVCCRCREAKAPSEFYPNKAYRSGHYSYCKPCHKAVCRQSRRGVSQDKYEEMLEAQKSRCAVCGIDLLLDGSRGGPIPQIDHCHDSGRIRGILCKPCNMALGLVKDDADRLRRMITYLDDYRQEY